MILRRAFYYAMFPAAVVLPVWLLVGGAVFGSLGWQLLGVLLAAVVLFVSMLGVAGLVFARASVRQSRAVSWWDTSLFALSYVAIVALGFFSAGASLVLGAVILLMIASFWSALWQFFSETRRRVREAFSSFQVPNATAGPARAVSEARNDGEYIVIETSRQTTV